MRVVIKIFGPIGSAVLKLLETKKQKDKPNIYRNIHLPCVLQRFVFEVNTEKSEVQKKNSVKGYKQAPKERKYECKNCKSIQIKES